MDDTDRSPEEIAQWTCDGALWEEFRRSEAGRYWRSSRAALHLAIIGGVLGLIGAITIVVVNSAVLGGSLVDTVQPLVGLFVLVGIAVLVGIGLWLHRRQRESTRDQARGEIVIDTESVTLNGLRSEFFGIYHWLTSCTRMSVAGRLGNKFEIVEFEFRIESPGYRTRITDTTHFRVPVPPGQLTAADEAIRRISSLIEARGNDADSFYNDAKHYRG